MKTGVHKRCNYMENIRKFAWETQKILRKFSSHKDSTFFSQITNDNKECYNNEKYLRFKKRTLNYVSDVWHTFLLQNEITGKTCLKKTAGTSTDILLTNRPKRFFKTGIFEASLCDHLRLILYIFCSYFSNMPPKTVQH